LRKVLRITLIVLVLVIAGVVVAGWQRLSASLPLLDGVVAVDGLDGEATIVRDDLGVVTIRAGSDDGLAFAVGFAHAQDRFFQMDLTRRRAAGELAGLFGRIAVDADRRLRVHRFRARAERMLARASPPERSYLEAYAAGVNASLQASRAYPFEYLLLRARPEPWRPADSLLIIYSMFIELNDERGERDAMMGLLHERLPPELVEFLAPEGTPWDAPVEGGPRPPPPVPSPAVLDLRKIGPVSVSATTAPREAAAAGSNNWAVDGGVGGGTAIVANDMHLPLGVPNVFYRQRLERTGPDGFVATGVGLPGTPMMVAGSNGYVAWGFTNSYGDWTDLVLLESDPRDPARYRTPSGPRTFETFVETIAVKGGEPVPLEVRETVWGPVIEPDDAGRLRAVKWIAHELDEILIKPDMLAKANTLEAAMATARAIGTPPQNIVLADREGRIAWTIMGRIPRPPDYDRSLPVSWRRAGDGWQGWLDPAEYPEIVAPPAGRIWTANARVVDGASLALLGDGGYALGARAGQIRDGLMARETLDVGDMLAIQLDDRALFYERWRSLLLATLAGVDPAGEPGRAEFARLVRDWQGRADSGDVGFRLVYEFRLRLSAELFLALTAPLRETAAGAGFDEAGRYGVNRQFEAAAWALLEARPPHLLNPLYDTWDAQILAVVDGLVEDLGGAAALANRTWGEVNVARIRHPLSAAIPLLGGWLNMPAVPLDGAVHMPRVQQASFGASERFAVSPGREDEGYFHMPGGQSGHPLSPFYDAGHQAWVEGAPTPFLPGPERHRLTLIPAD
jgi:penicillin amidase